MARVTPVSQSIHPADEVYVLGSRRMDASCWIHSERLWLSSLHAFNVQLKHRSELWPQSHANSIVVEVKHRYLISLLHQLLELIVQLNAEQDGIDIDSATCTSTSWRCWRCCFLDSLGKTRLRGWRTVVLGEPLEVLVNHSREDLVEDVWHLHHFKIKELKHEHELFANSVHDELVLGPKDLLEVKLLLFVLANRDHNRLAINAFKDRSSVFNISLQLFSGCGSHNSLVEIHGVVGLTLVQSWWILLAAQTLLFWEE